MAGGGSEAAAVHCDSRHSEVDRYRERVIDLSEDIQAIGWKAQVRLCQRYRRLAATGKPQPKVTTAIARELVGYAWDIARRVSPAIAG